MKKEELLKAIDELIEIIGNRTLVEARAIIPYREIKVCHICHGLGCDKCDNKGYVKFE